MVVLPPNASMEVLCVCGNGEIVIMDFREIHVKKRWIGHGDYVRGIAISDIKSVVVSVSNDRTD